jgi:DNA-binding IclR family transcriptional regulator
MADAFAKVRTHAVKASERGAQDETAMLSKLNRRQRILLSLFKKQGTATAAEMAKHLGMSHGSLLPLCRKWVATGFIEVTDASRKNRCYRLGRKS